jgi:pimeloyl-ACP methyl ester carboxylesterase
VGAFVSPFLKAHNFQYIQIGDTNVHYAKEGAGEPLLLIHGGGTWSYTWQSNITELARHFTIYVVDMPGFGLTTTKERLTPTDDYFADFIKSFLDTMHITKTHIVGSSWGGGWALRFAEKYPDYVDKLVVIGSAGLYYHKLKRPTFLWNIINIPVLGRLVSRYFTTPIILQSQYKSLVTNPNAISKNNGKELFVGFQNIDNRRILYEYGYRDMWRKTDENLDSISQPALIIWGEQDPMLRINDAYRLQKRISNATLEVLSDVGHLPHEEVPETVNRSIITFLKG